MHALTPALADDLPPLGDLIVDEPFWRYRTGAAGKGAAHVRVWLTAGPEPGHVVVVTEIGAAAEVTESIGQIRAGHARRYGPSLVLLEHHPAREAGKALRPSTWSVSAPAAAAPAARVAVVGGQSPSRRARALDGRARTPDRQQAGERLRLVPG